LNVFNEDSPYLSISGIQHFIFCKRQWGLIHIEQIWDENELTFEGEYIHQRAHDSYLCETREDSFISRRFFVRSELLKIQGYTDVIQFIPDNQGVKIHNHEGLFYPLIIEYKKGKPKDGIEDVAQLCAQAMSLEEMMGCSLKYGNIYYHSTHRRLQVDFDSALRKRVVDIINLMHKIYSAGNTPPPEKGAKCRNCSLKEKCINELTQSNSEQFWSEAVDSLK